MPTYNPQVAKRTRRGAYLADSPQEQAEDQTMTSAMERAEERTKAAGMKVGSSVGGSAARSQESEKDMEGALGLGRSSIALGLTPSEANLAVDAMLGTFSPSAIAGGAVGVVAGAVRSAAQGVAVREAKDAIMGTNARDALAEGIASSEPYQNLGFEERKAALKAGEALLSSVEQQNLSIQEAISKVVTPLHQEQTLAALKDKGSVQGIGSGSGSISKGAFGGGGIGNKSKGGSGGGGIGGRGSSGGKGISK